MTKLSKLTKEEFQTMVNESTSFKDILEKCNLKVTSGNYRSIRKKIRENNTDLTSINKARSVVNRGLFEKKHHGNLFCENSTAYTDTIKRRIVKENLMDYECKLCGLKNIWQDKKLVLILDHINGINNDHRLENLRFLCPNCNSQTDTFCGRNNLHRKPLCPKCKSPYKGIGKMCKSCFHDESRFNITKEVLEKLIGEFKSCNAVGRHLNISGVTVSKYCKLFNITV